MPSEVDRVRLFYRAFALVIAWILASGAVGCTAAGGAPRGGEVPGSGPPVIVPGKPGEEGRTAAPGETLGPRPSRPRAVDIRFVEAMIPHHRQALEMTALVEDRTENAAIRAIADRIDAGQESEISYMSSWLRDRGRRVPSRHAGHTEAMKGMATPAQMARLRAARGPEFDRLFLQLMITHHEGALEMAAPAVRDAGDRSVRRLAGDIINGQSAEIRRMRRLLE